MGKRLKNLSPVGKKVSMEIEKYAFSVDSFWSEAHIIKTTYYKLLFGKTS